MLYLIVSQWILLSKWLKEANLGRKEEIEVKNADLNVIMFLLYVDNCQNVVMVVRMEMERLLTESFQKKTKVIPKS